MRRLLVLLRTAGVMLLLIPVAAAALDTTSEGNQHPEILVAEFMAAGPTANEEFVELFNDSNKAINLGDSASAWKLQYFSSSKNPNTDTPSFSVNLNGTFYPKRRYLIAHNGYLTDKANASFTSNLANTSGYVRIVNLGADGTVMQTDLVGWGSVTQAEGQPLATLSAGKSYKRKVNEDGRLIDSNNNLSDFFVSECISPETTNFADNAAIPTAGAQTCLGSWTIPSANTTTTEPELETPTQTSTDTETGTQTTTEEPDPNAGLKSPVISELFPNPASPKTDDSDEFIELYNPNDQVFDLTGYRLEVGMTYSRGYTFGNVSLAPKSYVVFPITETKLQLSNTESQVRLLDTDKNVLNETAGYADAPDGSSWSLIDDKWQWTTSPTPGEPNILTEPIIVTKPQTTTKPKTTKATATPKKTAASKPKTATISNNDPAEPEELADKAPLHPLVLAGVGLTAVGYALYEYRKDFNNRFFQFRRYLRTRRASRAGVSG